MPRASFIDNEPDWIDKHPLGYRPNRKQHHKRAMFWILSIPRYTMQENSPPSPSASASNVGEWGAETNSCRDVPWEDPLYTSVTHENMNAIYEARRVIRYYLAAQLKGTLPGDRLRQAEQLHWRASRVRRMLLKPQHSMASKHSLPGGVCSALSQHQQKELRSGRGAFSGR